MPPNREAYNRSLQESSNAQMLLNIVRLRYGDTPIMPILRFIIAAIGFILMMQIKGQGKYLIYCN